MKLPWAIPDTEEPHDTCGPGGLRGYRTVVPGLVSENEDQHEIETAGAEGEPPFAGFSDGEFGQEGSAVGCALFTSPHPMKGGLGCFSSARKSAVQCPSFRACSWKKNMSLMPVPEPHGNDATSSSHSQALSQASTCPFIYLLQVSLQPDAGPI